MPTLRHRLSPLAEADIRAILEETYRLFGAAQQDRSFNLFMVAVERWRQIHSALDQRRATRLVQVGVRFISRMLRDEEVPQPMCFFIGLSRLPTAELNIDCPDAPRSHGSRTPH